MSKISLLTTLTGDYFQPVRLHYEVFDEAALLDSFERLRCVQHVPDQERWVWLYEEEARGLPLPKSHEELPPNLRPIVLGSFLPRGAGELLLDVRSCERAVAAVPFFDQHIPRSAARVGDAEVVNKLFPFEGNERLTPADLFDGQPAADADPEGLLARIKKSVAAIQDPQERLRVGLGLMHAESRRPLPLIERFPIHFYEDGIDGFTLCLKTRQLVARAHLFGNSAYTLMDAIRSLT